VGIFEIMVIDNEIKRMINAQASESDIRVYLAETKWKSLRQKALDVVDRGESTLEEVLRVTRSEGANVCDPAGMQPVEALA
jgi:type II secretory ATPase GspE/PulE/Tfp pilus assembly ATPase PilB-like protein